MATSGSVSTNVYKHSSFYCNWQRVDYSSSGNYSLVNWQAGLYISGNDYWYNNAVRINSVNIAGTTVMGSTTVSNKIGAGTYEMGSGQLKIYHDDDGTRTFSISISGWLYGGHDLSGSNNFTLNTIPRYTQIHASVSSVGLNSIGVKWTTDNNISAIQYRLNSGSWVNVKTGMNTDNGQFTISGLNPNTTYKVDLDAKRRDSGLWSFAAGKGASFSRTTKDIARISSYNSSTNLGDSYAIKYKNPSGAKVQVGIYDTDGRNCYVEYRTVTGSSYTFNFTDTELNSMYAAMGTSNSLSAKLYINTADNTYRESKNITIKLTGNIKTIWEKISSVWKRGKLWLKVNGVWKRAIMWKNVSGRWKRAK